MSSSYAVTLSYDSTGDGSIDATITLHDFGGRDLLLYDAFGREQTLFNKDLKPIQDTLTFAIVWDDAIANTLLTLDWDARVEVSAAKDGSSFFFGQLEPVSTWKIAEGKRISMSAVDNSEKLKAEIYEPIQCVDHKVCDPSATSSSLVHVLLADAEYAAAEIGTLPTISTVIPRVTFDKGEEYWDVLSDLLRDYHHVFWFDESGKFQLYDVRAESITPTATVNDFTVVAQIQINRKPSRNDGVDVTWWAVEEPETIDAEINGLHIVGPEATALVANNSYSPTLTDGDIWPNGTDVDRSITWAFQLPDEYDADRTKILYVDTVRNSLTVNREASDSGVTLRGDVNFRPGLYYTFPDLDDSDEGGSSGDVDGLTLDQIRSIVENAVGPISTGAGNPGEISLYSASLRSLEGVDLRFQFNGNGTCTIKGVQFFAPLTVAIKQDPWRSNDAAVDPLEVKSEYIFTIADARAVGEVLQSRLEYSQYRYSFQSMQNLSVGQYATLTLDDTSTTTTVRIVERSEEAAGEGVISYEAEGVAAVSTIIGSYVEVNAARYPGAAELRAALQAVTSGLQSDGRVRRRIDGQSISEGAVSERNISAGSITAEKIYAGDIEAKKIQAENISAGSITADKIAAAAITAEKLYAGDIEANRIQADNIAAGAVTSEKIYVEDLESLDANIAGWGITTTAIQSQDGTVRLRRDVRRLEVRSASDAIKTADGYLSGIIKADGTEFPAGAFGQYVGAGSTVYIESDEEYAEGTQWLNKDAAFVSRDGLSEIVRVGNDRGGDTVVNIGTMVEISAIEDDTGSAITDDSASSVVARYYDADAPGMFFSLADRRLKLNADLDINSTIGGRTALQLIDAIERIDPDLAGFGGLAYLDLIEKAQLGTTIISGGFISASLIDVDDLIARGSIVIGSDLGDLAVLNSVEAGNLGATIISGGKIRTDMLDVGSIIASGSIVVGSDIADLASTGYVDSAASTAESNAESYALSQANLAKNALAQELGYSSFADIATEAAANGSTLIVGGMLSTDYIEAAAIKANMIDVDDLFAEDITATGSLSAGDIPSGEGVQIKDGRIKFGSPGLFDGGDIHWDDDDDELIIGASTVVVGGFNTVAGNSLYSRSVLSTGRRLGTSSYPWRFLHLKTNGFNAASTAEVQAFTYDGSDTEDGVFHDLEDFVPVTNSYTAVIGRAISSGSYWPINALFRSSGTRIQLLDYGGANRVDIDDGGGSLSSISVSDIRLVVVG